MPLTGLTERVNTGEVRGERGEDEGYATKTWKRDGPQTEVQREIMVKYCEMVKD